MTEPTPREKINHHLDTTGLICPEPVMLLHKTVRGATSGEVIEVIATDPATTRDIPNFCRHLGHELLIEEVLKGEGDGTVYETTYRYVIVKG